MSRSDHPYECRGGGGDVDVAIEDTDNGTPKGQDRQREMTNEKYTTAEVKTVIVAITDNNSENVHVGKDEKRSDQSREEILNCQADVEDVPDAGPRDDLPEEKMVGNKAHGREKEGKKETEHLLWVNLGIMYK